MKRRDFMAAMPAIALWKQSKEVSRMPLSSNGYNWITFYGRENRSWGEDWDRDMAVYASTGLKAYEPGLESADQAKKIVAACRKNKISMPSVYVNSVLHSKEDGEKAIKNIMEIAVVMKAFGTSIFVTNPTPIAWGKPDQKTDYELVEQAKNLQKLNLLLQKQGITLAYHTHDMELKAGAREFHHMMQNTTVKFCMDVHWIYRGSENSVLPVFDVLKLYGDRIVELHLRQSKDGIWSETFSAEGDINYTRFANELAKRNIRPHIVIEQCVEAKSPNTMDGVKAHMIDMKTVQSTFKI